MERPTPAAASSAALCLLLALLPFEPRRPALSILGLEITLLELVAGLVGLLLLTASRDRVRELVRCPPLPLAALGAYSAAHLVSAWLAEEQPAVAFKFSLRMLAMWGFALLVAAQGRAAQLRALRALAASSLAVAALAILEASGVRSVDPFLDLFREMPFNVAGSRRATAGSEYPNQAAAFMVHGLVTQAAFAAPAASVAGPLLSCLVLASGLLLTFSRGALGSAAAGLLAVALALGSRRTRLARAPILFLAVLAASAAAFAGRGEIFRLRMGSEGLGSFYGARYEPAELPALRPGESRRVPVRVTNTGAKAWTAGEAFNLSYHWYELDARTLQDGGRTSLPRDLGPGESAVLDALVQAPRHAGRYLLIWDMVHEHTSWFSGQGVRPATQPVVVAESAQDAGGVSAGSPPPAVAGEPGWRPGRRELWGLALRMWRAHPVFGVGSDNFRWLYGRWAGRVYWDTRVFSNGTLVEAAATTGTAGALALLAVLVASPVAAWRRLRRAPAGSPDLALAGALLGLCVGLAAHGTVDYLLAFTGHYLFFGFVVGAAASPALPGEAA